MKWNRSLNTANGLLAKMGVKLCNYMFRPVFMAIVRLQSSSVKSLYNICNTQGGCLTSKPIVLQTKEKKYQQSKK